MSALGQMQTYAVQKRHVRFAPNSDIDCVFRHVCFGPEADIVERTDNISARFPTAAFGWR